jgi:hypothetical protein
MRASFRIRDKISPGGHMALTTEQVSTLKRYLEQSETMHHRIMAKMTDPRFDLLDAWEQKERLDQEIGRCVRAAITA